eukprot:83779-Rhodomonas_salina.1
MHWCTQCADRSGRIIAKIIWEGEKLARTNTLLYLAIRKFDPGPEDLSHCSLACACVSEKSRIWAQPTASQGGIIPSLLPQEICSGCTSKCLIPNPLRCARSQQQPTFRLKNQAPSKVHHESHLAHISEGALQENVPSSDIVNDLDWIMDGSIDLLTTAEHRGCCVASDNCQDSQRSPYNPCRGK